MTACGASRRDPDEHRTIAASSPVQATSPEPPPPRGSTVGLVAAFASRQTGRQSRSARELRALRIGTYSIPICVDRGRTDTGAKGAVG